MAKKTETVVRSTERIDAVNRWAWVQAEQDLHPDDFRLLERMAKGRYTPTADDHPAYARVCHWATQSGRSNFMLGLCSGACESDMFTTLMPTGDGGDGGFCPVCLAFERYIPMEACPSPEFVAAYEELLARGVPHPKAQRLAEQAGPSLESRRAEWEAARAES